MPERDFSQQPQPEPPLKPQLAPGDARTRIDPHDAAAGD